MVRADRRRAGERRRFHEACYQRVKAVYDAAMGSDASLRGHFTAEDVNLQNPDGDSALHMAYYTGQADAIARLTAFGADETLRNREGLTPAEMGRARGDRAAAGADSCLHVRLGPQATI